MFRQLRSPLAAGAWPRPGLRRAGFRDGFLELFEVDRLSQQPRVAGEADEPPSRVSASSSTTRTLHGFVLIDELLARCERAAHRLSFWQSVG